MGLIQSIIGIVVDSIQKEYVFDVSKLEPLVAKVRHVLLVLSALFHGD